MRLTRFVLLLLAFCAFAAPRQAAAQRAQPRETMTILISIDGFRPDYLERGLTPNLSALAARGVTGPMRPSFPSKTYPNHHAMVTGLRPDHNGIVENVMEDPALPGETFRLDNAQMLNPFWWSDAEPVWITAERAGLRTAMMFWPGSEVPHGGILPADWSRFYMPVTNVQRVETVLDWVRRPAGRRPRFVTLYFDTIDSAGHDFGPDSPALNPALVEVDARIGDLVRELADQGQPVNLIIVSDHGMAATDAGRVIPLGQLVDPALVRIIADGVFATLAPQPGREAEVEAALLRPHAHATCWRRGAFPARFHYGTHRRVAAFFCLAETGWLIAGPGAGPPNPGNHGYDNEAPEMRALFIASGPAFRAGVRLPLFENVDVYPLLARLIGVTPRPNDGSIAPFRDTLAR